jgi:hypothetical protein
MPGRPAREASVSARRPRRLADRLPGFGWWFFSGATLVVIATTYLAIGSVDLIPRGGDAASDAAFRVKYCARDANQTPGLIVAQPNPQRVDVDATIWSSLSVDQRRTFVSAIGCVDYGHPMAARETLQVVAMPSQAVLARADGAAVTLLE